MRVAMIALLALPVVAGIASPAFACPLGSSTGPVSQLPCTVLKLACGGSTTTPPGGTTPVGTTPGPVTTTPGTEPGTDPTSGNTTINNTTNNITNNITNNFFNGLTPEEIEAAKNGKPTTTTTASTTPAFAFPASGAGGGVGAGGGGGLGGGSFSGGSSVGGMPINPSADLAFSPVSGVTSSSGSSGGGFFSTTTTTLPSSGSGGGTTTTSGFVLAAGEAASFGPITPGVSLAALPAPKGGDDSYTIAMASPATAAAVSPSVPSSGFGLEGPAADAPMKAGVGGTPMLAGLLGLGVLGAGWAWRALVV
jgi:hypothetical protein